MRTLKIYALVDPRDGSYRYIGKTKDIEVRYRAHIGGDNPATLLWISKLQALGLNPEIIILEETPIQSTASRIEREWIKRNEFDLLNRR